MNTINKIQVDGVNYNIQASLLTKVTYAELKEMRDKGSLAEGHLYRITDYEFTTLQTDTKSAEHPFDVIVLATAENQLSELARAIQHEGDTYFDGNDLGAWELWYDLDNDTDKYEWADAENGKGVIYRMIDEKRNDCPYDFKNALFYNTILTTYITTDRYYYTFSYISGSKLYDGTVEKQVKSCYDNSMGVYITDNKKSLSLNVFRNISFVNYCSSNTLGSDCNSNTFGADCHSNTFRIDCCNNIFGNYCRENTFGDICQNNKFENNCWNNKFGNNCQNNTFGDICYDNKFGDTCGNNTFGNDCEYNNFGNFCQNNKFANNCKNNKFENHCINNTFEYSCNYNTFGNDCDYNTFTGCNHNTFGNNVCNRELNTSETSITLNEEYYDDGSGQLVPIKHPDLSTQPSILPYKFMGLYVYEQLIPKSSFTYIGSTHDVPLKNANLEVSNPIILDACLIYSSCILYSKTMINDGKLVWASAKQNSDFLFAKIIYTSMPEEGGDYYGYNNY